MMSIGIYDMRIVLFLSQDMEYERSEISNNLFEDNIK